MRRKKMQVHGKVGKSRFTAVFPMICGSGGLKRRLAKAAGAEPDGQMRDKQIARCCGATARSTLPSQNIQSTPFSNHFWKLRCSKSARRCGAKHVSKSKVSKIDGLGALLEFDMSKKVHAVVARSTFGSQKCQKCQKLMVFSFQPFLMFRCRKRAH